MREYGPQTLEDTVADDHEDGMTIEEWLQDRDQERLYQRMVRRGRKLKVFARSEREADRYFSELLRAGKNLGSRE